MKKFNRGGSPRGRSIFEDIANKARALAIDFDPSLGPKPAAKPAPAKPAAKPAPAKPAAKTPSAPASKPKLDGDAAKAAMRKAIDDLGKRNIDAQARKIKVDAAYDALMKKMRAPIGKSSAAKPAPSKPAGAVKTVSTKGGNYPVYKKGSAEAKSFGAAFNEARKAGLKTFPWGGRSYSTKKKGE